MQVGRYQVHALVDAFFGLDGGAMFGIIPRPLWEREQPPDDRNRIRLACRCLLLRDDQRLLLLDTGIGDKWSARELGIYAIDRPAGLPALLKEMGIATDEITDVIQTHLHFDHAGGLTRLDDALATDGQPVPTYAAATLHVQRRNWEWAFAPSPRDAGSYRPVDWAVYENLPKQLRLVDGAQEIVPGVEAIPTDGHTPGQQAIRIRGDNNQPDLIYCGDLFPTHSHLRLPWNMGYDLDPLQILREKQALLEEAARDGSWLAFEHDPVVEMATVSFDGRRTRVLERAETGSMGGKPR